jgi:hypothetical protein
MRPKPPVGYVVDGPKPTLDNNPCMEATPVGTGRVIETETGRAARGKSSADMTLRLHMVPMDGDDRPTQGP